METGIVKWFNRDGGYGFISSNNGNYDLPAHYSEILSEGFQTLEEGQCVEFNVTQSPTGRHAANIRVIKFTSTDARGLTEGP